MNDFFNNLWNAILVFIDPRNLPHPERYQAALSDPNLYFVAMASVCFIVFAETGLLFGFLFPGDSLLVVLGVVLNVLGWSPWPFVAALIIAAIVGEIVGYWIGARAGPALFNRPDSRFFKKRYLQDANAFFERHGGKAIVIARFMPFVRTFVPVAAGMARMPYRQFTIYNIAGAILWIGSMVLFGYYALDAADRIVRSATGNESFTFAKHLDKIVIVVVFVSVAPMLWAAFKKWRQSPPATTSAPSRS
jgi:membrane-associated protein